MSEQYQVLTYRFQRNDGQEKLQRVVIDADAHRVDPRGELRLTQEMVVDMDAMEQISVTLSPAPFSAQISQTMPVVMGVVPDSDFAPAHLPAPASTSSTLGLCSSPTRRLQVNDGGLRVQERTQARSASASQEETRILRGAEPSQTSTHEELAQIGRTRSLRAASESIATPNAGRYQQELAQGRVKPTQLVRPSWEALNLRDEAPVQRKRPRNSQLPGLLLLFLAATCTVALLWGKFLG